MQARWSAAKGGRADSIESGEEEAVVSSLQRQLSASVSQLEARKQLEQLESNHKELDSSKRKLEGELQARRRAHLSERIRRISQRATEGRGRSCTRRN